MTRSKESTSTTAVYLVDETESLFGALLLNLRALPENREAIDLELRVPISRTDRQPTLQDAYIPDPRYLVPVLQSTGFEQMGFSEDKHFSLWTVRVR